MKQKKNSKFDSLVERFIAEFAKIPDLDLLSTDERGKKALNIIAFRNAEIASYKTLICNHFIPATNKAIYDDQIDYQKSKYKFLLDSKNVDFKETLYDTIRLAYVGLFHKIENYVNDVIVIPNIIFDGLISTERIDVWAKEKYKFDIKNWQVFPIIYKINWICNCVKHKDGYPVKEPKPLEFRNIDTSMRIRVTPEEFRRDCETLIECYPLYLQAILTFTHCKVLSDVQISKDAYSYHEQIEEKNKAEASILKYVEHMNSYSKLLQAGL